MLLNPNVNIMLQFIESHYPIIISTLVCIISWTYKFNLDNHLSIVYLTMIIFNALIVCSILIIEGILAVHLTVKTSTLINSFKNVSTLAMLTIGCSAIGFVSGFNPENLYSKILFSIWLSLIVLTGGYYYKTIQEFSLCLKSRH